MKFRQTERLKLVYKNILSLIRLGFKIRILFKYIRNQVSILLIFDKILNIILIIQLNIFFTGN